MTLELPLDRTIPFEWFMIMYAKRHKIKREVTIKIDCDCTLTDIEINNLVENVCAPQSGEV